MEYLSPLYNSPHRSIWPAPEQKNRPSVYIFLSPPQSPRFSPALSPRLSVSGDLRRAVKSTHVSLAGSSIRAELRVTFTHLLRSDICCADSHPLQFQ
ncbi:hypothetical protein Q8A67_008788 [Cirrhinus molitorella]|uniref:Uncharacterized protein n=1 Tax=Cirrhinus molitorella TaxID=172907 RepID=A0AA88PY17_9TELE|nr:hypothetical protein Q8A67_008788 [Cirrhinus molitorella]